MQTAIDESSPPTPADAMVPAVSRALMLLERLERLERLARQRQPMSSSMLAAELSLPRSSVHGLCNTLLHHGLLRRQGDRGFLIGSGVMNLAQAFVADTNATHEFGALWRDARVAAPRPTLDALLPAGPLARITHHRPHTAQQLHAELERFQAVHLAQGQGREGQLHRPEQQRRCIFGHRMTHPHPVRWLMSCVLALGVSQAAAGAPSQTCPSRVHLASGAIPPADVPAGFQASFSDSQIWLSGFSVFEGLPEKGASLAPVSSAAGTATWKFEGLASDGRWLSCDYANGLIHLASRAADTAKSCKGTFHTSGDPKLPHAEFTCQ
jgi:hypothetical protein